MTNAIRNFVLLLCVSLAAGMFTNLAAAPPLCTTVFTKIEPSTGVPGGKTSTVILRGSCLPTGELQVGFSDKVLPTGVPVNIVDKKPDQLTVSVNAPSVSRESYRQFSYKVGNGPVVTTAFSLKIVPDKPGTMPPPTPGPGPAPGPAPVPTPGPSREYVTNAVFFRELRRVEAKADRAIGLAEDAQRQVSTLGDRLTGTENTLQQYGERLQQLGPDGELAKRFQAAEAAIAEQKKAITQARQLIDAINRRPVQSSGISNEQLAKLITDFAALQGKVDALDVAVRSMLDMKLRTGGKKTLRDQVQWPDNQIPQGGVLNPVQ